MTLSCCHCCLFSGEGILAAADKAMQHSADGSKGGRHQHNWVPLLPSARSALLSVLVHTEGVEAAGKVLLSWQEHGGQQGHRYSGGRKGKAASSSSREPAGATAHTLLSLPLVNSFLAAAVSVVSSHQQEGADEEATAAAAAAAAAVEVAGELFKQQLLSITLGAGGTVDLAAALPGASASHCPAGTAAVTLASLAQLYGALGDWQQVSSIVLAAVRQQVVGVQGDSLQVVLSGAAAALNAAGRHVVAVQLLDALTAAGATDVSHPGLAQQLLAAAEADDKALQVGSGHHQHW